MRMLAAHQPELVPYTGFWHKMVRADVFDLAIWDAYSHSGYHRRFRFNGDWVSCKLHRKSSQGRPICEVMFDRDASAHRVWHVLDLWLRGPYRHQVIDMTMAVFESLEPVDEEGGCRLLDLSRGLMWEVMDWLSIPRDRVQVAEPLTRPKAHGIVELMEHYGAGVYLAGPGSREYMGTTLEDAGYEVVYSTHDPPHGDTILRVLAETEDPMSVVLRCG